MQGGAPVNNLYGGAPASQPPMGQDPLSSYSPTSPVAPRQSSPVLPGLSDVGSIKAQSSNILGEDTAVGPPPSAPDDLPPDHEATRVQPHPSTPYSSGSRQEDLGRLDPNWIKIRRIADGQEIGPVSLKEVRSLYVHGKISLDDEYTGPEIEWSPIRDVRPLLDILQRTPQLSQRGKSGGGGTSSSSSKSGLWAALILFLVLGGLGGGGYYVYKQRKGKSKKNNNNNSGYVVPADILTQWINQWKKRYPSVKSNAGQSKDFTARGLKNMARDQKASYRKAISLFRRALIANPKNRRALGALAIARVWRPTTYEGTRNARELKQNQYEVLLRRKTKTHADPLMKAAYALYLNGDPDRSLALVKKALRKASNDPLVNIIAGYIYLNQQQDNKKARSHLRRALKRDKTWARARILLSSIYLKTSHYFRAERLLKPLLKQRHPEAYHQQAIILLHTGRFESGRKILQKALARRANYHTARLLLAKSLYQLEQKPKAALRVLSQFKRRPGITPSLQLQIYLHRGYANLLLGRWRQVVRQILSIKKYDKNKNYLPGLFLIAQYWIIKGKPKKARKSLSKLLARLPSDVPLQTLDAMVKEATGQQTKAKALYQQLSDQNTRYIWPRLLLARAHIKAKEYNKALLQLKATLDVEPDLVKNQLRPMTMFVSPQVWQPLVNSFSKIRTSSRSIYIAAGGIAAYQMGNMRLASKLLRRSLTMDYKGLAANLYLAQFYFDRKSYGKASRHASRAYRIYDQHAISTQLLGLVALKKRQYKQAGEYFSQVRKARPWFITSQVGLAAALLGQGYSKDAKDELKPLLDTYNFHHMLNRVLLKLKH